MVQKSAFRNEHVEAYLEGRFEEVPADVFEIVKGVAERRAKGWPGTPLKEPIVITADLGYKSILPAADEEPTAE